MVDTVLKLTSDNRSGVNRWDLKNQDAFPQWELDTLREIRKVAPPTFLDSTRPKIEDVNVEMGSKRQNTDANQAETLLRKLQEQWDSINQKVYEVLEERVLLCE